MGKPRVNLPSLARSPATTTCIDTANVSRNPIFTPPSQPLSFGQPSVPVPASNLAVNYPGFSALSLCFPKHFQKTESSPPTFTFPSFHHHHSNKVDAINSNSWPSQPWPILFSGPPPKPLPEGKERAQLWKKLTPSDQDDLLYGRVDFYELKAKYDALEQASQSEEPVTVESVVAVQVEEVIEHLVTREIVIDPPSIVEVIEEYIVEELPVNLSNLIVKQLTVAPQTVGEDVSFCVDFDVECEFQPATPDFVVCDSPLGSGLSIVGHGPRDVVHYRFSQKFVSEDQFSYPPLYNFKKRRRKW